MTAAPIHPDTATPGPPPRDKTGIPKNPGRRDLGMKVSLLFPDRDIVEKFYVPVIYTACRTCYSEEVPEEIQALTRQRDEARLQKQWQLADELRDRILALGYVLEDQKGGTRARRKL